MLIEAIITILAALAYWLWRLQPTSAYVRRPYKVLQGPLQDVEVDYVVVGAGPGGLAAVHCLLQRERYRSVLLIERGADPFDAGSFAPTKSLSQMHNLLSYAVDLVGLRFDNKWCAHRPLREQSNISDNDDETLLVPYPRGCGVGGTSIMDWALFLSPISIKADPSSTREMDVPHAFTSNRSPLSWGFAESVGMVLKKRHLATLAEPQGRNSVFPGLLRLDEDGRRLSLPNYLMRKHPPSLTVVEKCEVTGMCLVGGEDKKGDTVTSVSCRTSDGRHFTVAVRRGVILSAGVVGTARLLRRVFPRLKGRFALRDSIAVPLILQSLPGLSDDRRNLRSARAQLLWWMARRGPFLNPVCDTLAAVDVPSLGPQAELVIFFLPFGGRDRALYSRMGLNNNLGAFTEACTLLMALRGVDDILFDLVLDGADANKTRTATQPLPPLLSSSSSHQEQRNEKKQSAESVISSPLSTMPPKLIPKVVEAFVYGMSLCRRIVAERPLSYLLTGNEAVDASLLHDRTRAIQYVRLTRTPPHKLTERQRAGAPAVFAWAKESLQTQAYMEAYVHRHATWLGFGSGSCASMLSEDGGLRVAGTRNVLIGDCSGVTERMWKLSGCDTLRAGSVSTAMAMGTEAANELLSI